MIFNLWSKKVHSFTCQLLVGNGDASYECKAENCLDYSAGGNSWGLQRSHEMFPLSVCLSLQGAWRSFQPLQLLLHTQPCNDFSYTEPQWWRILNWKKRIFKCFSIPLDMLFMTLFQIQQGLLLSWIFINILQLSFIPKLQPFWGLFLKTLPIFWSFSRRTQAIISFL